jgi:hypothetical protein
MAKKPMQACTNMIEMVSALKDHLRPRKYTSARKIPRQKVLFMMAAPSSVDRL